MSNPWTPGPWAMNPAEATVDAFNPHLPVCQLLWPTDQRTEEETKANARLIAAAPSLVEALDSLCFETELILKVGAYRDLLGRVNADVLSAKVAAARAALSLAKGTQTQGETK